MRYQSYYTESIYYGVVFLVQRGFLGCREIAAELSQTCHKVVTEFVAKFAAKLSQSVSQHIHKFMSLCSQNPLAEKPFSVWPIFETFFTVFGPEGLETPVDRRQGRKYRLLSTKTSACLCTSAAIEMGSVSQYSSDPYRASRHDYEINSRTIYVM